MQQAHVMIRSYPAAPFAPPMAFDDDRLEQALLAAHRFARFEVAVDVGGGEGTFLAGLLARHPRSRGILFDRPGIANMPDAPWRSCAGAERIVPWSGDFFRALPGADLYLLKAILGDWTDAHCRVILRNIRSAISPMGRVAVIEELDGESAGFERSADDYRALFKCAGFQLHRITSVAGYHHVLEAVAV